MINIGDRVKSNLSLWKDDVGIVSNIIPIWSINEENIKIGDYVYVIFPETDKHYSYQQSFNSKELIKIS